MRGVWSYNIVKMDRYNGWKLISLTVLLMYFFSCMFYFMKYKNKQYFGLTFKEIKESGYFITGILSIIGFHIFTMFDT